MFTLLPQHVWLKVTGNIGQLEAVKLNLEDSMVCVEDQRKNIVLEKQKFVERQLNGFEEETNKLADRHRGSRHLRWAHEQLPWKAQAYVQQDLGEELKERNCQITGTKWMHPWNVWEWK